MAKFAESNIPLINITEIEKLIKGTDIGYFNSPIIAELDQIGNGKWDKEGFKWSQNLNGSPEVFIDLNQNSIWDEGEEYLDQDGLLDIGKGNLYNTKKFNMIVVWFGLMICLGSTIYIGFVSYQQISRQMRSYDPNS